MNALFSPGIRVDLLNPRLGKGRTGSVGSVATRKPGGKKVPNKETTKTPWDGVNWQAILSSAEGRSLLRCMGCHAAQTYDEIIEAIWHVNCAMFRLEEVRERHRVLVMPTQIREVLLALHASLVDNDREQLEELARLGRLILRSGSPTARKHGAFTGAAMAHAADWGKELSRVVQLAMPERGQPGLSRFAVLVGGFLATAVPKFKRVDGAPLELASWFEAHPEKLAIEDPEELAVQCCIALGMPAKDARNAIKSIPSLVAKRHAKARPANKKK